LLAQLDVIAKERFHQRALAQLKAASVAIASIRNMPIRINMLIILGRRYAAIGEMTMAKTLLDQSVQLLAQTKISNSEQAGKISILLGRLQAQLGQFEAAWATSSSDRVLLIEAMLKSRSPQSVLPLVQTITNPETKAQALGAVVIAFAQQGNPVQGRTILQQAISAVPLDENPQDIYHPWFLRNPPPPKKTAIRLDLVFPLVANYAKAGQTEAALEIAQGTQSKALMMAIKTVAANEYAKTRDPRATNMMDDVKTQMGQASQNDTYPVVRIVFSELMENHQYRLAWDITKTIDVEAWKNSGIGINAPIAWTFLNRLHGWQSEIIKAAIADKRYDIVLDAAREDYGPLEIAIPALVEAGFVKEALTAIRRTEPRYQAELLAILALKLERQQNLAQAKRIWAEAITAAQQIKEGKERAWALISVAAKLQYITHQPQNNGLLQKIIAIDNAFRNDKNYQRNAVIQDSVESSLIIQSPHLAIRLVDTMPPSAHRERNQISLFQNLLSFWDEYIPEAEKVLAKMPRSVFKVRSQIALADAYFTWGQLEKSSETLNQARIDLQKIQDAEIIEARSHADNGFMAENKTPWFLKKESRSSLLGYIALGYTKMQDRTRATQVLPAMPNVLVRREWRSHLACYSALP
jgi:tetratricopeptide (TPR) repeat protein